MVLRVILALFIEPWVGCDHGSVFLQLPVLANRLPPTTPPGGTDLPPAAASVLARSSKAGTFGTKLSACQNRKFREGDQACRLARNEVECCRPGGESKFSKVIRDGFFPPLFKGLLNILECQGR
ncbi:hypothetical protein ES707_09775 [subsurface metagenome]